MKLLNQLITVTFLFFKKPVLCEILSFHRGEYEVFENGFYDYDLNILRKSSMT